MFIRSLTITLIVLLFIFLFSALSTNNNNDTQLIIDVLNTIHLIYIVFLSFAFFLCSYYGVKSIIAISKADRMAKRYNLDTRSKAHTHVQTKSKDDTHGGIIIRISISLAIIIIFLLSEIGLSFYFIFSLNSNNFDAFYQLIDICVNFLLMVMFVVLYRRYYTSEINDRIKEIEQQRQLGSRAVNDERAGSGPHQTMDMQLQNKLAVDTESQAISMSPADRSRNAYTVSEAIRK